MTDTTPTPEPIPRPVGTQAQHNEDAANVNPLTEVDADENEQAQYNQFVSRFIMSISDPKSKLGDATLKMMNNSHLTVPEAVGQATANIAFILVQNAKAQKITYAPDVLFHAAFECVCVVYVFGLAAGIFHGIPFKGMQPDGTYPFDEKDLHILVSAQMQAVRYFGNMELKNGMITPQLRQSSMQFWHQQIEREIQSGAVNEDVLKKLGDAGVFKGRQQAPQPQQPQPTQQPPQQAAPSPMPTAQQPSPQMPPT